jgi:hypothetical protein
MAPCGFPFVLALEVPTSWWLEIRRLIREMSIANPLWGAPRIANDALCRSFGRGFSS